MNFAVFLWIKHAAFAAEMCEERSWTWTLSPGEKHYKLCWRVHTIKSLLSNTAEALDWDSPDDEGFPIAVAAQFSKFLDLFWIRNKCMIKFCCLLEYLGNLDVHISRWLAQQIQTDRKPTEKPNNKQACTNLKDLQMVFSGCMSTITLKGRKVYQMTSVLWLSRPFPSMLISIKHFSPTLRNILIWPGPTSWAAGGLCNYQEEQSLKENVNN